MVEKSWGNGGSSSLEATWGPVGSHGAMGPLGLWGPIGPWGPLGLWRPLGLWTYGRLGPQGGAYKYPGEHITWRTRVILYYSRCIYLSSIQ